MLFYIRIFELLLVWPLPWDHFTLEEPTRGYCPKQHSSQGHGPPKPTCSNEVAILWGANWIMASSSNQYLMYVDIKVSVSAIWFQSYVLKRISKFGGARALEAQT